MKDRVLVALGIAVVLLVLLSSGCQIGANKPTVSISAPADGDVFNQGTQVTVVASAIGGGMIQRVGLSVDGTPYDTVENPHISVTMKAKFTWQAADAGSHTLQVIAHNKNGVASDPASITVVVQ